MPLLNGRPIKFQPHPTDLTPSTKVFQIRFTSEVLTEYQEYCSRLDFYRQPKFCCKYTGKSGFTFEQALNHENQTKQEISNKIPSQYLAIILKTIQFSQLKLTDLVNTIHKQLISEINKEENALNNEKPLKTAKKAPLKKTLIRTQIRICAQQQNFKNAPWILNQDFAEEYNISTELPSHLQSIITEYLNKKNKKRIKPKTKEKSVKLQTLISALSIKCNNNKQFKYPIDDQLLLMYDKLDNDDIIEYDLFWKNIEKIGIGNRFESDTESYSNLAFIDYNRMYDIEDNKSFEIKMMRHRQLNEMFHQIWKIWSFFETYHDLMGITPFPISFLMDALCYEKRCILLDEVMLSFLDLIRKHFLWFKDERIEAKRELKLKRKIARKKARKKAKKKRESIKEQQSNDKEEMDQSEDDDNDDDNDDDDDDDEEEDTESESESELESESESESESDESLEDDMEMTESEDDYDDEDIMDILSELKFTQEPFNGFRLEILRNYLHFRCNNTEQMILPINESVINDEIWDRLSNIRSYISLGIEAKLSIIKILFKDIMHCESVKNAMEQQIKRYRSIKYDIKTMEDEYTKMVKDEKLKLRNIRNDIIDKKKILNPTKKSKTKTNSPNKENKSSKANSISATSRQQEMLKKKEEEEKEVLKEEIFELENALKNGRDLMNDKLKEKELWITLRRYSLLKECRTHLMELGSDRFNNKYLWSKLSDGRIFVLHSNSIYHKECDDAFSITQNMMKLNAMNGIKCYNEWQLMDDNNKFCWSYISRSKQFYDLLSILDERGIRESKLLLILKALKKDIVYCMKLVGNDDYEEVEESVTESMDVDDEEPKQLRRSKRATKAISNSNNNGYLDDMEFLSKGFLSYRNKLKRK